MQSTTMAMRTFSSASSVRGRATFHLRTRATLGSAVRCGSTFVPIPVQPDSSIDRPYLSVSLNPPQWNESNGYSYLSLPGLLGFGIRGMFLGGFKSSIALQLAFSTAEPLITMKNFREDEFTFDRERQELRMTKKETGATASVFLGERGVWFLRQKVQQAILVGHGFDIPGVADGKPGGVCVPSFAINRYPVPPAQNGINLKIQTNPKGDRVTFQIRDFEQNESRNCQFKLQDEAVWLVRNVGDAWIDGVVEVQGDSPYGSGESGEVMRIQELSPTQFQVSIGHNFASILITEYEMAAIEAVIMCQLQALTRANFLDDSYQQAKEEEAEEEEDE